MISSAERSAQLRTLISRGTVTMPGAFNALSARLIQSEGFEAMYLSGAVLANSVGGVPDVGLMSLSEARELVSPVPIVQHPERSERGTTYANTHCSTRGRVSPTLVGPATPLRFRVVAPENATRLRRDPSDAHSSSRAQADRP